VIKRTEGRKEVVRALVEAGANIDQASTIDGATPLYASAQNGHAKAVRALLEAGVDINLTCSQADGMTPALCAALLGHEDVEKLLRRAPSKVCGNPSCKYTAWTASMKGAFKKCSGCLGVKYCSQSCQRVHWKEHKKVCNKS
jgi:ankyrin repeat protein